MSSCCGWACVDQANVGVIEQFGEFVDVIPPGANYIGMCGYDLKGQVSLRTRLMHVFTQSLSVDKVMLELKTVVMFHVIPSESHTAFYSLSSINQINAYVDNCVRGEIARCKYEEIFFAKEKISQEVRRQLHPELAHRGFEVDDVLIKDIRVPRDLMAASERQLEMKYIRKANYYKAEANKIAITTRAEGEAECKRLSGVGAANMQVGAAGGFADLVGMWNGGDQSSEVMAMILMQQYFDTLTKLTNQAGKGHLVLIPERSLLPHLRQ